jgi:hypothetical protein
MEICDLIPSQKGKDKLNVYGYLFLQNQSRKNKFYWRCNQRISIGCKGQTFFVDGQHYSYGQNNNHNHAPKASKPKIAKIVSNLKQRAGTSKDKPAQIIQSIYVSMDINNAQSMPSKDAVRRQNVMSEPTSLDSLNIPEELKHTLNGELFLINESEIENDKILLFTTLSNLRKLELAKYWIMDKTFKTIPTIFHQLYSIHAPVGHGTNLRILPLVFALLSSKSKECYIRMFQDLQDICKICIRK